MQVFSHIIPMYLLLITKMHVASSKDPLHDARPGMQKSRVAGVGWGMTQWARQLPTGSSEPSTKAAAVHRAIRSSSDPADPPGDVRRLS